MQSSEWKRVADKVFEKVMENDRQEICDLMKIDVDLMIESAVLEKIAGMSLDELLAQL